MSWGVREGKGKNGKLVTLETVPLETRTKVGMKVLGEERRAPRNSINFKGKRPRPRDHLDKHFMQSFQMYVMLKHAEQYKSNKSH